MKVGEYVSYSVKSGENLATIGYVKSVDYESGCCYVVWFNPEDLEWQEGYYEPWYIRSLGGNHYGNR